MHNERCMSGSARGRAKPSIAISNSARTSYLTLIRLKNEFVYLAVILDGHSRKVVGWDLDRTLAARLPLAALDRAIIERQPPPGLVHHSDRGVQYASGDYIRMLEKITSRA
jgi:putative transposase